MEWILALVAIVIICYFIAIRGREGRQRSTEDMTAAVTGARQVDARLAEQIEQLENHDGSNAAAEQALAEASERHEAASAQAEQAQSQARAHAAKQTALAGLYYVRAARIAMDMNPGPLIPELDGQAEAGRVSEDRAVEIGDRTIAASPRPSTRTPNHFPGGLVAGQLVPAGWYSEPWWKPALYSGEWDSGSDRLFRKSFAGISGVGDDAQTSENVPERRHRDGMDNAVESEESRWGNDTGTWV